MAASNSHLPLPPGVLQSSFKKDSIDTDFNGGPGVAKYWIEDAPASLGGRHLTDGKNTQYVVVTGSGSKVAYQTFNSIDAARNAYIAEYAKYGGVPALKKALLASGYLNKSTYASGDWTGALDSAINDSTISNVTSFVYEKKQNFAPLNTFLGGMTSGNASTSKAGTFVDKKTDVTLRGDANKEINSFMLDSIGREATPEEKEAFFQALNKRELTATATTKQVRDSTGKLTDTATTGSLVTPDERTAMAVNVLQGALGSTTAEAIQSSAKGSKIAVDISTLQANSAAYGHSLTAGEAMKMVMDGFGQKDYVAKQVERMRLNSMTMYGNLKQHIADGGTVKDITDQYAKLKAAKLGIAIPDSLADKDVMAAITQNGGLMSTADFTRQMQANPLWRQTEEAHNTAADFANTILKSFGFMG